MTHLLIAPRIIMIVGLILYRRGINVRVEEIGFIHDKIAPAEIANEDKRIMGLIIGSSSFKLIIGDLRDGDHIVTRENRRE